MFSDVFYCASESAANADSQGPMQGHQPSTQTVKSISYYFSRWKKPQVLRCVYLENHEYFCAGFDKKSYKPLCIALEIFMAVVHLPLYRLSMSTLFIFFPRDSDISVVLPVVFQFWIALTITMGKTVRC